MSTHTLKHDNSCSEQSLDEKLDALFASPAEYAHILPHIARAGVFIYHNASKLMDIGNLPP